MITADKTTIYLMNVFSVASDNVQKDKGYYGKSDITAFASSTRLVNQSKITKQILTS